MWCGGGGGGWNCIGNLANSLLSPFSDNLWTNWIALVLVQILGGNLTDHFSQVGDRSIYFHPLIPVFLNNQFLLQQEPSSYPLTSVFSLEPLVGNVIKSFFKSPWYMKSIRLLLFTCLLAFWENSQHFPCTNWCWFFLSMTHSSICFVIFLLIVFFPFWC